ncbi:MAG: FAD-dependent oxidoreductase [Bdellovibrionia bacterium]
MTLAFPYSAQLSSVKLVSTSYLILGFHRPADFDFKAGQHVTLQLEDEAGVFQRTYSIASPPSSRTQLEFCIQVEGDTRSATLLGQLKKGIWVKLSSARGDFLIPASPGKVLVFIAGGSGISPLRSMIYDLLASPTDLPQIHLLYGCREAEAMPFLEELDKFSRQDKMINGIFHPLFFAESFGSRTPVLSGTEASGKTIQVHPGRVTAGFEFEPKQLLSKSNHFYLCGPPSMVTSIESLLVDRGISPSHIVFERYG